METKTIGDRARARRLELGRTLQEVSDKAGISPGALSDLEKGRSRKTAYVVALARALEMDPVFLETGRQTQELRPIVEVSGPTKGYWLIPRYEAFMSAGDGDPGHDEEPDRQAGNAFREDFCRAMGWHPSTHFTARIDGDSMIEAGLRDGWSVVVDTRQSAKRIVEGEVYAIRENGRGLFCKFLQPLPDGGLRIISANSSHPLYRNPRDLSPEEAEHVTVLGRVVHAQGLLSRSR